MLRALTLAAAWLSFGPALQASSTGTNLSPVGDRAKAGVEFAAWDQFTQTQVNPPGGTTYTFNGVAGSSSTLTNLSLTQTTPHALNVQGSGLLEPTGGPVSETYYSSTFAQNWSLQATASVDVTEISFQIKTANVNPAVGSQLYVPTLNGVGAGTFVRVQDIPGQTVRGFAAYVIEYRWTGLNIEAGTPLQITFSMAGGSSGDFTRKPVDYISLDVRSHTIGGMFAVTPQTSMTGTPITANFANWSDAQTPLNYAVYRVDGTSEVELANGPSNAPVLNLQPGTYTLRGKITNAIDHVTVVGETVVTVLPVDKIAPAVKITAPTAATVAGAFELSGTVKENLALESFNVTFNGQPLVLDTPLAFVPNATLNWKVANVTPENGPNTIVVEAVDYAGRVARVIKTITYVNTGLGLRAGTYNAVLLPAGTPDVDTTGLVTVTLTTTGAFSGKVALSGVNVPISGIIRNSGAARFKPTLGDTFDLIDKVEFDSYLGSLALSVSETSGLVGTLSTQATGGTVLANFAGKVAPYTATNTVAAGLLNLPVSGPVKGQYAVAFPSKEQNPVVAANLYPQGAGYLSLTLAKNGAVTFVGYLADGTRWSGSTKFRSDDSAPLYLPLYKKRGAIAGELTFANATHTDVTGTNFLWLRPAQPVARYYPAGWPNGVKLDAIGTKYAAPASLDFGQGVADPVAGNAKLTFSAGGLASSIEKAVSINPGPTAAGQVKLIPAVGATYKFALTGGTGEFSGAFTHGSATDSFRGILLNKGDTQEGYGYFLSTPTLSYGVSGQGGKVALDPAGP